jgi:hypothetical protein
LDLNLNSQDDWFDLLNLSHNAYHSWRLDHLSKSLQSIFAPATQSSDPTCVAINVILMVVGTFFLWIVLAPSASILSLVFSLLSMLLALLCIFGKDSVVFGSLSWLPWLAAAVFVTLRSNYPAVMAWIVLSLFFAVRVSLSANQLALLLVPATVLAAASLPQVQAGLSSAMLKRRVIFLCVILSLPAIFALYFAPVPFTPDYPPDARVLLDQPATGMVPPLFGNQFAFPVINRWFLRETFGSLGLSLLALSLLVALGKSRSRIAGLLFCSALLGLAVFADAALPENLSQIAPLAVLPRMIDGLYFFPLAPLALALGIFLIFTACATCDLPLRGAVALVVFCLSPSYQTFTTWPHAVSTVSPSAAGALNQYQEMSATALLSASELKTIGRILLSPSYKIVNKYGLGLLNQKDQQAETSFKPLSAVALQALTASAQPQTLALLHDGRDRTRWSPGIGQQSGQEWIQLEFKDPVVINALDFGPGVFSSDYPRGVRIKGGLSCVADLPVLFEDPFWEGSVHFTPQGFPYLLGPNEVIAYFTYPAVLKCLRIEQMGRESGYDWSVGEISLGESTAQPGVGLPR